MAEEQDGERRFRKPSGFIANPESSKLYRIALEECRQSLSVQLEELNGMRSKAVSFVSFIGTATAFLVSMTIKSIEPNGFFYAFAGAATLAMIWTLIQTKQLLSSSTKFAFKLGPFELVDEFIEDLKDPPSEAELLRALTENYANRIDFNQPKLEGIRRSYNQVVLFGLASIFIWAVTMWSFGTVGS